MAVLRLAPGPGAAFASVEPLLVRFLGEGACRLGGGTVLAARWGHRHSTDVDLSLGWDAFHKRLFERRHAFADEVRALSPAFVQILEAGCLIGLREAEVSLTVARDATGQPLSGDRVEGSRVPVESTAEILARKLRLRMLGQGLYLPRDMYDIAVARERDPAALATALETMDAGQRRLLVNAVEGVPEDLTIEQERKGVASPAYPNLARHAREAACAIIARGPEPLRNRHPPARTPS